MCRCELLEPELHCPPPRNRLYHYDPLAQRASWVAAGKTTPYNILPIPLHWDSSPPPSPQPPERARISPVGWRSGAALWALPLNERIHEANET